MSLEQLTASVTTITELQSVLTTALGIPTSVVENIEVSLGNSSSSRRLVQDRTLDIAVALYQDSASQSIANQEILSMMQLAVEQAAFSEMNVTSIVGGEARYEAMCGNGVCETNEAVQGHPLACEQDCSSTQECPRSDADTLVGEPGTECAGRGTCTIRAGSANCSCAIGHQGELVPDMPLLLCLPHACMRPLLPAGPTCAECEYGFVPRGSPATCTPTRSRFQALAGDTTGIGAQLRRTLLIIGVVAAVLLLSGVVITVWCCCTREGGHVSTQAASSNLNDSMQSSSKISWVEHNF